MCRSSATDSSYRSTSAKKGPPRARRARARFSQRRRRPRRGCCASASARAAPHPSYAGATKSPGQLPRVSCRRARARKTSSAPATFSSSDASGAGAAACAESTSARLIAARTCAARVRPERGVAQFVVRDDSSAPPPARRRGLRPRWWPTLNASGTSSPHLRRAAAAAAAAAADRARAHAGAPLASGSRAPRSARPRARLCRCRSAAKASPDGGRLDSEWMPLHLHGTRRARWQRAALRAGTRRSSRSRGGGAASSKSIASPRADGGRGAARARGARAGARRRRRRATSARRARAAAHAFEAVGPLRCRGFAGSSSASEGGGARRDLSSRSLAELVSVRSSSSGFRSTGCRKPCR